MNLSEDKMTLFDNEAQPELAQMDYESKFEEFRQIYKGRKRGLTTEFNLLKKHKDWKEVCLVLKKNYEDLLEYNGYLVTKGDFVPASQHLKTYINQRSWEIVIPSYGQVKPHPRILKLAEEVIPKVENKGVWDRRKELAKLVTEEKGKFTSAQLVKISDMFEKVDDTIIIENFVYNIVDG